MIHQILTLNHRLESWVYPDAPTRTGATGFVAGDVGRISYQSDTGGYYRLTTVTPTWALIALPVTATLQQAQQASPTGTAVAAPGVMVGLGGAAGTGGSPAVITPITSGKIHVTFCGSITNTSTGGAQVALRYGTGTAPANGAAPAGSAVGGAVAIRNVATAGQIAPFSLNGIITGLTLGTQIWLDAVQVCTGGAGTAGPVFCSFSAFELP